MAHTHAWSTYPCNDKYAQKLLELFLKTKIQYQISASMHNMYASMHTCIHACTHARMHAHTQQLFYGSFGFVWDYTGEPVPER